MMLAALCGLVLAAPPPPQQPGTTSLLVMKFDVAGGASEDLATDLNHALIDQVRQYEGFEVRSMKGVESLMTVEMQKQLIGCDTESCAAEIAGALNADEIIVGRLNKQGSSLNFHVFRVRARGALNVGSGNDMVPANQGQLLLERLPAVVNTLMSGVERKSERAAVRRSEAARPSAPVSVNAPESSTGKLRTPLRVVGAAVAVSSIVAGMAGAAAAVVFGALMVKDVMGTAGGIRGVTSNEALLGNLTFWAAIIMLPVTLLVLGGGAALFGASWALP